MRKTEKELQLKVLASVGVLVGSIGMILFIVMMQVGERQFRKDPFTGTQGAELQRQITELRSELDSCDCVVKHVD